MAQTHQIVLLVGMTWATFAGGQVAALRAGTPDAETARAMTQLGKRWFVIPNRYGSWEKAVPRTRWGTPGALRGARGLVGPGLVLGRP